MTGSTRRVHEGASSLMLVETPSQLRTLARTLCVMLGIGLAALVLLPWQQSVGATGRVIAFDPFDRVQTVAAPVDGRIRHAWVVEGSRVAAGDPLLEIVDNDPEILERLQLQRDALGAQLAAAREKSQSFGSRIIALESARDLAISAARSRIAVAVARLQSARHGVEAANANAQQARANYLRQEELVSEGLASTLDFELAQRAFAEAEARGAQEKQALAAAENDLQAERAEIGRIESQANAGIESARASGQSALMQVASLEERIAQLDSRVARQTTQLITAPRAATILRVHAAPGAQLVKAGDPLVMLIPDTESRAVELWVDGNDVPLVHEGRKVRLQFEGWPAVQFAGWPSVAVGTFGGRVAVVDSSADARGRFRLLVVPDADEPAWPDARTLRQGARANGFVLLDQVSLGYEFWRQANGFPPAVALGEAGAGSPDPVVGGES